MHTVEWNESIATRKRTKTPIKNVEASVKASLYFVFIVCSAKKYFCNENIL